MIILCKVDAETQ
ncbi:hypothetical protein VTO73DRAFT_13926 [Trametes versicolor]